MTKSSEVFLIEKFYEASFISASSFSLCKNNSLKSISDLKKHLIEHGSFENLKNCGKDSNRELIKLSHNYLNISLPLLKQDSWNYLFNNLTKEHLNILDEYIALCIKPLKVRPRNAIKLLLKNNPTFENLLHSGLLCENFDLKSLKNVGNSSYPEVHLFVNKIKTYAQELATITDQATLGVKKFRLHVQNKFGLEEWPEKIGNRESVFKWAEHLIYNNCFCRERDTTILLQTLALNHEYRYEALDNLPVVLELTRQRIEQIRDKQLKEIPEKLKILRFLEEDIFIKYNFEQGTDLLDITETEVNQINQINSTSFSQAFITTILGNYIKDYAVVGSMKDTLIPKILKSKERHYWKKLYLLHSDLEKVFDFMSFANDLHRRLAEKIENSYSINLISYLGRFFSGSEAKDLQRLKPICKILMESEFDGIQFKNNDIVFERTTYKQNHEYAYEALVLLDKASDLTTIASTVALNYPDIELDEDALRNAMKRNEAFVVVGNQSIYGLKSWEDEKPDFKGGFFKDIVKDYLEKKPDPIHILELVEEISKYRDRPTAKSLREVLKADPGESFQIFNQNFVGLSNKDYSGNALISLPVQLGKSIVAYVRNNHGINKTDLSTYWSNYLNISKKNCDIILDYLLYTEFLYINENQQVYKRTLAPSNQ